MKENIHLGTVGRTRVGLNWSVVVTLAIIAFGLAAGFRDTVAGLGAGLDWAAALVTAVLFLASLLGHELSHAVVARRRGMTVDGILLWALGGVATLNGDAPDARSELRIAIAGPAASASLAGAFGLLALGFGVLGASLLVVTALWWLAGANLLLALFNLLPAYPLDGGRVLRAGLWRHWGDRLRATDAAAGVGGFFGAALIGIGIVALFFTPTFPLNGIWLALIGWFVLAAGQQEREAVRLTSALDGLRVGDAMHPVVAVGPVYATLEDLVQRYMGPGHLDRCPLVDLNGGVTGLLRSDQLGHVPAERWRSTRASDVAWPLVSLAQTSPGAALAPLVGRLSSLPSHSALVWENGRLVGTLTASDVGQVVRTTTVHRGHSDGSLATAPGR